MLPKIKQSDSQKLRVVCVGAGYFSRFHYESWKRMPDVDLVALCNRDSNTANKFADEYEIASVYSDIALMLETEKPDLIDIITPPVTHRAAVMTAAKYGVNAVCQKPFALNAKDARELTRHAQDAGIALTIHENFRFMPWIREIKKVLNDGSLGRLLNVRFNLRPGDGQGAEAYLDRQPYFQTMERLLVHETAIHFVDCFRYLFGEPEALYARLKRCNRAIKGEDAGIILFDCADGLTVTFDGNRLLDHASSNTRRTFGEMLLEGDKATLRLDGDGKLYFRSFGESTETEYPYNWRDEGFAGDCVYQLNRHIVDHYLKHAPIENTAREYLRNIELEELIYDSHFSGRRITLQAQANDDF